MTAIKISHYYKLPEEFVTHVNALAKLSFCDKTINRIFSLTLVLGQLNWY